MNRTIIERLNSLVKTNDVLYFLGDFCIGPKAMAMDPMDERRKRQAEKIILGISIAVALIGLLILNWLFLRGKR
jgi:calcineurin-like phosphoesterase family protein